MAPHQWYILSAMNDVTQILSQIEQGDSVAAERLLPLVYDELRKLAASKMAAERGDHTLQATALVHEAYLRLIGSSKQPENWNGRGHFFASAAEAMRRILVENARRKRRIRHGGEQNRVELLDPPTPDEDDRLLALDEALDELAGEDPLAARVVELRRFAGLNHEQIASALNLTVYQARQKWTYARAWLHDALKKDE
jgi:RNA polymerase sigma factor (TIGR02999 family)